MENKPMMEWPRKEIPLEVRPMTDEEAERIDKVLKEARALRASMLKRRKGKLVPSSIHIISQARDEYP